MIVTIQELKTHLRVEHDEEDEYLGMLIKVAGATAMDFCRVEFDENDTTPEPVRLAVLLHASHFYTNRENGQATSYQSMIRAFHALLWPYRDTGKLV